MGVHTLKQAQQNKSNRVAKAIERVSKYRYVSGVELRRMATFFAVDAGSGAPWNVAKAAIQGQGEAYGYIGSKCVVPPLDLPNPVEQYRRRILLDNLERLSKRKYKQPKAEREILNFYLHLGDYK